MEPPIIGLVGIVFVLVLMLLGLPIGIALLLAGTVGSGLLIGMDVGISLLGVVPFTTTMTYMFAVLPLFMVMGLVAHEGGLTTELFDSARKFFGHLPGGLAVAVTFADACFASITGESLAASVIMAKVALPEMRKYKYSDRLSAGCIAVGGTLGPLIPPSAGFILYGLITETSIGKLFIAGILPGLMVTVLFMVTVVIWVKLNPAAAEHIAAFSWRERLGGIKGVWPVVLLFLIVIGGIYAGVFTPVEGGAIGAFFAIVIALLKRGLKVKGFLTAFRDTMRMKGMIFMLLIGAFVFNYFMALSRLPMELAEIALSLQVNPYLVFGFVVLILLFLGCIMDVPAMIVLSMPILFPVMMAVGFDPIWFGVVSVVLSEVGFITPPVGMNVYIVAGVTDVPLYDIFKGILPFLGALFIALVLLTVFPQIATFLPNMMMK